MPTKLWIHFLIHPLEFDQGMKMAIKLYGKTLEEQREPSQTNLKTEKQIFQKLLIYDGKWQDR